MKVIAINGSPHPGGTTYQAIASVLDELVKNDIETELIQLGTGAIQGCTGCMNCRRIGKCVFNDDPVNETVMKIRAADGLVIGSPVYYAGINGSLKSFLDRLFFAYPVMRYKVAAAVVALRRSGGIAAFHQLNSYFYLAQMIVTPNLYWNITHGSNGEEALRDGEGMQILRTAGRNMAWLLKTVDAGKKAFPLPEEEERVRTNFIR